jgi:hypothetical protein
MSATTETEPTLFDTRPREAAASHAVQMRDDAREALTDAKPAQQPESAADAPAEELGAAQAESAEGEKPVPDRKRLKEQLEALKRKEAELRRALAVTDHPELADAIRSLEASVYCVTRAEAKLSQGFSKGEARRREVIEKKLTTLREKRTELDTQIVAFESELEGLGTQRLAEFETERKSALKNLMVALATHDATLSAAGFEAHALVPEIATWMPELEAVAREVSSVASA